MLSLMLLLINKHRGFLFKVWKQNERKIIITIIYREKGKYIRYWILVYNNKL